MEKGKVILNRFKQMILQQIEGGPASNFVIFKLTSIFLYSVKIYGSHKIVSYWNTIGKLQNLRLLMTIFSLRLFALIMVPFY